MSETPSTRTRGPYKTGVRRRQQLIAVTVDVLTEHGYVGGSIRAIAKKAGVSHATLIHHFGSREGLIAAALEEWDRRTVAARLAGVSGLDYFRRLPEVMAVHQRSRGLLELFTSIATEVSSPSRAADGFIVQHYTKHLTTLFDHLREAVVCGDVASMTDDQILIEARLLLAAMDGIGVQWLLDPSTDVEAALAVCIDRAITSWSS